MSYKSTSCRLKLLFTVYAVPRIPLWRILCGFYVFIADNVSPVRCIHNVYNDVKSCNITPRGNGTNEDVKYQYAVSFLP